MARLVERGPQGESERKLPERKLSWTPNILVRQKNAQEFMNEHQEFKDKEHPMGQERSFRILRMPAGSSHACHGGSLGRLHNPGFYSIPGVMTLSESRCTVREIFQIAA